MSNAGVDDIDLRRRVRAGLLEHARACREAGWSAVDWEDIALESEAGRFAGAREVEAVWRWVWGL